MEQLGLNLAPERRIYTVAELTSEIRDLLEVEFGDLWVMGEISNARAAPSGHHYFTLKDGDAQIRAVCFRQQARYLKIKPQNGLAVMARGRISVYEARGEYQIYVEHLEPQGYGTLQLAFEQLKKKLAGEGLFDPGRKRALPALPRHIGIVTSPSGAAIADMLRILQRRFDGLHIQLYPVRVQGEEAAVEIARGLRHFSEAQSVEVVIVGRGGGSLEDLWAFNEETVARAIAASEVPVISAVGHETDFTIADFVADLRAPTPSAAAELVVRQKAEFLESVRALQSRLAQALRYKLATSGRQLVESSLDRATTSVRHQLSQLSQRLDEQSFHLQDQLRRGLRSRERRFRTTIESLARLDLRVKLAQSRSRWDGYSHRLPAATGRALERFRNRLDSLDRQLAHLSPLSVLERGYPIVQEADGSVLRSSRYAEVGDSLSVRLHEGALSVRVEETK